MLNWKASILNHPKKLSIYGLPFPFFLLSSYVFKTFRSIQVMYDCFMLKAPLILQEKNPSICIYINLSNQRL